MPRKSLKNSCLLYCYVLFSSLFFISAVLVQNIIIRKSSKHKAAFEEHRQSKPDIAPELQKKGRVINSKIRVLSREVGKVLHCKEGQQ